MHQASVQILLSTYNGECWLPALWESLKQQSWDNWQLLIRDDGSADDTTYLIDHWVAESPERVVVLKDREHVGTKESYNRLLEAAQGEYFCFCDQDDIWLPEKIHSMMVEVRAQEYKHGKHTPILVHSDLIVTDEQLNTLHSSFWRFRRFRMKQNKKQYLVQNIVTGCASLFNQAAAELAFPIPDHAMEHDRWLALVTKWFGVVSALPMALVKYRQHAYNQIGAFQQIRSVRKSTRAWCQQANAFLAQYYDRFTEEDRQCLLDFSNLNRENVWRKRQILQQYKLHKAGLLPTVALLTLA
jgi:glycosyltransferase involved in cell wall biosynthesis